ncbi:hypothetical protein CSV65_00725 [Sporosarcina sp. P31]|nr:hypothetical protein CSV66_00720 [Sporosarcina sp. P30]PID10332.1 hypothetical protein CSV65_00725 [Sporosarcina sp. P31]PID12916.1 hypothetical protein CSV64_03305 [Sporosarcina sp. P32b]
MEGIGVGVLRKRDNFYIYFSIFSLIFILILVYFFYEKRYCLSDFLDVKTIFQVIGTVFGAYFGAKVAGKYAIDSAEKIIFEEKNNRSELFKKTIIMDDIEIYSELLSQANGIYVNKKSKYEKFFIWGFKEVYSNYKTVELNIIPLTYLKSYKEFEFSINNLNSLVKQIDSKSYFVSPDESPDEAFEKVYERLNESRTDMENRLTDLKRELGIDNY